jgi:hypothetical protein
VGALMKIWNCSGTQLVASTRASTLATEQTTTSTSQTLWCDVPTTGDVIWTQCTGLSSGVALGDVYFASSMYYRHDSSSNGVDNFFTSVDSKAWHSQIRVHTETTQQREPLWKPPTVVNSIRWYRTRRSFRRTTPTLVLTI